MRRITEGERRQTGKMKELVVRAGKYCSVFVLLVACLPVLLPLLFFLSVFGFTFVLPLGCTLAAFLSFRKYVGMLYKKLRIPSLSAGRSSRGRRRQPLPSAAPISFTDLPLSNAQEIETSEAVDPEFDAVVVSTAPREVQEGSVEGANDPDIRSGSGADVVDETPLDDGTERGGIDDVRSLEHGSKREGKDADSFFQDGTTLGVQDDDGTLVENGTRTEVREDDTSAEDRTREEETSAEGINEDISAVDEARKERIDEGTSAEDGKRREGLDEDISVEDGKRRGRLDEGMSVDDGNRRDGVDEATSPEDDARKEGIDEGEIRNEGIYEDISAEDGNAREGKGEDTALENEARIEVREDDASIENGIRREGMAGDGSVEDETRKEGIDEDTAVAVETRNEGIYEDTPAEDGNGREGKDEDISVDEAGIEVREDDASVENGVRRDVEPGALSVEDGTRREGTDDDGHLDGEKGGTVVVDGGELQNVGRSKELSNNEEEEFGVEHLNEEKVEKITKGDDDFHTLPSTRNHEGSVETLEDVKGTSRFTELEGKGKEDEVQDVPTYPEVVIDEGKDKEINNQALEEETTKRKIAPLPDESLMLGELDSDDEERTLVSPTSRGTITPDASYYNASEEETSMKPDGVRSLLPHQANGDDIWICKECGWKYPNAKPSAKIRRNHKKNCKGRHPPPEQVGERDIERTPSTESNAEGDKFISVAKADNPSSPDRHHPKRVAIGDDAADSSALVGMHDEDSSEVVESESFRSVENEFPPIASESFRSAPDDFPIDRWSSLHTHYDDEQDQLAQMHLELELSDDLNAVKGVVGDKHVSTGPLLTDIEELSEFLGIDLPARTVDMPEIEWAKLAIEVMKVVVGID